MKNSQKILKVLLTVTVVCFTSLGCASMYSMIMQGGTIVPNGYEVQKVIVAYRAEGTVPARIQYFLVETDKGQAIFERSEDGSGTLFQTHWIDDQGDHFAGWVFNRHGYEFVIPTDRTKEGKKYFYPARTYAIKTIDGIRRPVPDDIEIKPVARLIPK
jgi:hypothetical protein